MEYVERTSSAKPNLSAAKAPLLEHLDIELTERCDNNCIHCCINLAAGDRSAKERELTTPQLQRILQETASLGALHVRFTGGEPLLRPDFQEIYLFARRLGLKVLLFTNGRRITPRLADLFAHIPPLLPIEISVYGMRPSSYEAVSRVKGSFDQFWNGMELLREREVPFVVKSALLPPIRSEIDELESWAADLPWMDGPLSYTFFFDKRSRHDDPEKDRQIQTLRPSPEESLAVMARNPEKYRKEMGQFCRRFLGPPGDRLFLCGAGNACCVDAYGRLQPCMALRLPELTYDLREGSLLKALRNFFPRLREIRAASQEYLERCARCFLSCLCEQCPGRSWSETGTLDTPVEYLCSVAHYTARWLGLVGPKEHAWKIQDWQSRLEHVFRARTD